MLVDHTGTSPHLPLARSLDYMAKTAPWAVAGAKEGGFDPDDTRHYRKDKEGKRDEKFQEYANQGC